MLHNRARSPRNPNSFRVPSPLIQKSRHQQARTKVVNPIARVEDRFLNRGMVSARGSIIPWDNNGRRTWTSHRALDPSIVRQPLPVICWKVCHPTNKEAGDALHQALSLLDDVDRRNSATPL